MNTTEKADVHSVDETKQRALNAPEEHKQIPRLRRFWLRLCRQQPMTKTFNSTILTPDATPTSSKVPDVPPNGVALVVGGPPSEEAGCEGGGASITIDIFILFTIGFSIEGDSSKETKTKKGEKEDKNLMLLPLVAVRTLYDAFRPPSKPGVQATVTESCVTFSIFRLRGLSGCEPRRSHLTCSSLSGLPSTVHDNMASSPGFTITFSDTDLILVPSTYRFAFACSATINDSFSTPTAVDEGGGTNLGRSRRTPPPLPSIGMPSFHQDNLAGGLLELESHIIVASMPGFNSSGSMRILTVSGF
uniref:Uncharacterized protein n=1 Tax=Glossina pallidipes TaxID=7398 RepID=A0A1B0A7G3_GLOPL